jgi:hypothetical protein
MTELALTHCKGKDLNGCRKVASYDVGDNNATEDQTLGVVGKHREDNSTEQGVSLATWRELRK